MRPFFQGATPIRFAHRGGATLWPENTLHAFRGALELGYRYIETDIHATRDGELVIFHDAHLDRTTNGFGPIAERTLAELRRLDAAYRFGAEQGFPLRGRGINIPTLTEALALSPDLRLNIDIKAHNARIAKAVWEYIDHHKIHDRVLIASEHTPTARTFSKLSRGTVATSAAAREALLFWSAARAGLARYLPKRYDALQVPRCYGPLSLVTTEFVQAAHDCGLQVHVWTIDDEDTMRALLRLGVDGIMTDRPDVLNSALHSP